VISENGTAGPHAPDRRWVRRTVVVVAIVGTILIATMWTGEYMWSHSAKVMHRCWGGSESEICPPSGASQGSP
jgi:hypothetical protein